MRVKREETEKAEGFPGKGRAEVFELENNGRLPEGEVVPRGGLLNVKNHVENAGGRMEIFTRPAFMVRIVCRAEDV